MKNKIEITVGPDWKCVMCNKINPSGAMCSCGKTYATTIKLKEKITNKYYLTYEPKIYQHILTIKNCKSDMRIHAVNFEPYQSDLFLEILSAQIMLYAGPAYLFSSDSPFHLDLSAAELSYSFISIKFKLNYAYSNFTVKDIVNVWVDCQKIKKGKDDDNS